jgi:dTDP-4-dehydrorhamnose reductase
MLRLGKEQKEIRVVEDQTGTPSWCRIIAGASAGIARQLAQSRSTPRGLYHLCAAGFATRFEYARAIFDFAAEHLRCAKPALIPVSSEEFSTPAARPAYSVLSGKKLGRDFGISLPDWRSQLALCIGDMK